MAKTSSRCWCGNADLQPFSPEYWLCKACDTLVLKNMPDNDMLRVSNDETDFYGKNYYLHHLVEQYGLPDLESRVRNDMIERNLHWLKTLLKYKLPPAKSLELGSAHGGFVAILHWAGFDANGLELSPWLVDYSRQLFRVPVFLGPIEDQSFDPGTFDIIVLMDVLEHLANPVETMRYCLSLLKPDGIFLIQTPCFPQVDNFLELQTQNDSFLQQFKPKEHLYLFSQKSAKELFQGLEVNYIEFLPAIFSHYDMFFCASRTPLAVHYQSDIEHVLESTPGGRMVQALLNMENKSNHLEQNVQNQTSEILSLQQTRLYLDSKCKNLELENEDLGHQFNLLRNNLVAVDDDRAARLVVIEEQGQKLGELEAERNNLHLQLDNLGRQFEASESDRAARLVVIEEQGQKLGELEGERNNLRFQLDDVRQKIDKREAICESQALVMEAQEHQIKIIMIQLGILQQALQAVQRSRVYKVLRWMGRWDWLDNLISHSLRS